MTLKCNHGYLLIELMIAILLLTISGLLLGYLRGQLVGWHKQAELHLDVVIIANQIFQKKGQVPANKNDAFKVTIKEIKDHEIPFKTVIATIIIPGPHKSYEYTFQGGFIDLAHKRHHTS